MKLEKGLVAVYTGNGKGKTTASVGQGIRCAGNDLNVRMVQFLKGGATGEMNIIETIPNFTLFRFERPRGFFWTLDEQQKKELQEDIDKAMEFVEGTIDNNYCDVLILDEVMGALSNNLIDIDRLVSAINRRPDTMEIIMTGRNVPEKVYEIADYVTEMKDLKHPFEKGIAARKGIEW